MTNFKFYKKELENANSLIDKGETEEGLEYLYQLQTQLEGEISGLLDHNKSTRHIKGLLNKVNGLIEDCNNSDYDEEDMINMMFPNGGDTGFDNAFGDDFFE